MIKAVIFDFNGTLFFDTDKHEKAWLGYAEKLLGRTLSRQEFESILGRNNKRILEFILGRCPTDAEVEKMGGEKEAVYRDLCLADRENMHLAKGAEDFLDELKRKNIPIAIATSSDLENVNFYFEYFGIDRWFDRSLVIYNDGTMSGKPAPDIYLKAAEKLGVDIADCAVFEDAVSGVASARNAGAAKIYAVASATRPEVLAAEEGVTRVISDYTQLSVEDVVNG